MNNIDGNGGGIHLSGGISWKSISVGGSSSSSSSSSR